MFFLDSQVQIAGVKAVASLWPPAGDSAALGALTALVADAAQAPLARCEALMALPRLATLHIVYSKGL